MALDFIAKWDVDTWKERCADQRKIAERYPAYDVKMVDCEEYGWKLGPWSLRLTLEIWQKPFVWHASAAIVEQIGWQTVGGSPEKPMEVPEEALLATSSWIDDHRDQARFILGEMMSGILRAGDKHQPAREFVGLWAMHHTVNYEGDRPWTKRQS